MKSIKAIATILLYITLTQAYTQTIEVKQDGTGDYTLIQDAVDASVDGQTVLVWPGTYYENIVLTGKDITLASLVHTTGDSAYKFVTIIDGNQTGGCIDVRSSNGIKTIVSIIGFTLTNGIGSERDGKRHGGGLLLLNSEAVISDCIIENNSVSGGSGGGIYLYWESNAYILNCSVNNNNAKLSGGGIACIKHSAVDLYNSSINNNYSIIGGGGGLAVLNYSEVYFDTINLCSIYNNFAAGGCDITKGWTNSPLTVVVDTFTVINPDTYFIYATDEAGCHLDVFFEAQNSTISPCDGNLYVNPVSGNNNNSGTSTDEPLQTIAYAYSKIAVDSLERNTIHLANGVYSDSANNERFPLNIRPYINVVGESMKNTVFDGEHKAKLLSGNKNVSNYSYSKISFIRGTQVDYNDFYTWDAIYADLYDQLDNISFDSITFNGGTSPDGALFIKPENNFSITNCTFKDIVGERALRISTTENTNFEDTVRIENCSFLNNYPDTNNPTSYLSGGGLDISRMRGVVLLSNCLFDQNDTDALLMISTQTWINNCTFVNNSLLKPTSTILDMGSTIYMYNSIMYNNGVRPIAISYHESNNSELYISNSLLEDGEESITIYGNAFLYYDNTTNINKDPLFTGVGEHPYQIDYGSPCIDKGTMDLPSFITIPEFDLAGNQRVVGNSIDMGAYEWNPSVDVNNFQISTQSSKIVNVAPNPFSKEIKITITTPANAFVRLEIIDNQGQIINTPLNSVSHSNKTIVNWNGKNKHNISLPNGNYHLILFVNNIKVDYQTIIKI